MYGSSLKRVAVMVGATGYLERSSDLSRAHIECFRRLIVCVTCSRIAFSSCSIDWTGDPGDAAPCSIPRMTLDGVQRSPLYSTPVCASSIKVAALMELLMDERCFEAVKGTVVVHIVTDSNAGKRPAFHGKP